MPEVLKRDKEHRPCYQYHLGTAAPHRGLNSWCCTCHWQVRNHLKCVFFFFFSSRHKAEEQCRNKCVLEQYLDSAKRPFAGDQSFVSHRILSLQFQLVDGQSLSVLQLLDLLHLLVVASDLLIDDHLHAPGGRWGVIIASFCLLNKMCCAKALMRFCRIAFVVLHGRLGNIFHAEQGVGTVWTAKDARGKNYGQWVWRHAVVCLILTHPARVHWMLVCIFFFIFYTV